MFLVLTVVQIRNTLIQRARHAILADMGRRLGQHFLTRQWAAVKLVEVVSVRSDETILEIGPGKGALTRELLKTGAHVVAVEKDKALVAQLKSTFNHEIELGQLELIEKDVRDLDPRSLKLGAGSYVVAANIPYYITGEIIRMFLTTEPQPRALALLVQKEVAERVIGKTEGRRQKAKESILSISVKAYGTPKIAANVPRGNFSPQPSVDSAILVIENVSRRFLGDVDESSFFNIVRAGFSSKRKLLASNLATKYGFTKPIISTIISRRDIESAFEHCGIPHNARAEDVPLQKWKCLARQLVAG